MIYKLKSSQINSIERAIKEKQKITVRNLQDAERAFLLSTLNKKVLYVASSLVKARMLEKQFTSLGKRVCILSQVLDIITYKANTNEILSEYCGALSQICLNKVDVVIILPDLLLQRLPKRSTYISEIITLTKGGNCDIEALKPALLNLGYKRVEKVENAGEFAVRGDILDVFPIGCASAVRVDFWGDEIECIKAIDLLSYTSREDVESVSICPLTLNVGDVNASDLAFLDAEPAIKEKVLNGIKDNSLIFALPAYADFCSSFVEWFSQDIVAIDEPKRAYDLANDASLQLINDNLRRVEENIITKRHLNFYIATKDVKIDKPQCVIGFTNLDVRGAIFESIESINFTSAIISNYVNKDELLKSELEYFSNLKFTVLLCYQTPEQCSILQHLMRSFGLRHNVVGGNVGEEKQSVKTGENSVETAQNGEENLAGGQTQNTPISGIFSGCFGVNSVKDCAENVENNNLNSASSLGVNASAMATASGDIQGSFSAGESDNAGIKSGEINIINCSIAYSVGFMGEKFACIATDDLFRGVQEHTNQTAKARVFYLPKVGDYVVHTVQGIGKCIDIKKMNLGFCEKDYIVIEYAKGDVLYLPTEHTDEISQYLGGEENPRLNVLGGEQFRRVKEKARESLKQLAFDLKALYAKRKSLKGFVYSTDNYLVDEFQKACGFELTKDQADAINDIKADMESGKVMDRLICGDVGFGKTEVAMVAAFKTILNDKQVAFLAPTTVLCHQHYINVLNRMKEFMVSVGMLSRFNTAKENDAVIKKIASGEINIVCGTHRMLSDDVHFKDLGLLILDEEQRFGVADKEKIKRLKESVNVLTLSATPIPRTLHMSLIGVRDTSLIVTPPKTRLPITSIVCELSPQILVEACRREISRGGQVLIVFNRVDGIYEFAEQVRGLLPDVEISVAHGQMDKNTLEGIVLKLYAKEVQVLVATTLIENGIDLPMANTLIVVNADAMGLSQLYQLRGRVGRSNRSSFAYFTYDKDKMVSEVAMKRLETLKEFSELGSGFKIAMRDLEIRGAGTLLGAKQSGHIEKIGYDLYCKLLEEVMLEMEGKADQILRDVKIEIAIPAFAPESYIASEAERIKLYNNISMIKTESEAEELKAGLVDIYGKLPNQVEQLILVGLIKNTAKVCGVKKIVINDFASMLEFYEDCGKLEQARAVSEQMAGELSAELGKNYRFVLNKGRSIAERQNSLINFLLKLSKVVA